MRNRDRLDRLEDAFGRPGECPEWGGELYVVAANYTPRPRSPRRHYPSVEAVPRCPRCGRPHGTIVVETVVATREEVEALRAAREA